jgi:hypothetical protein
MLQNVMLGLRLGQILWGYIKIDLKEIALVRVDWIYLARDGCLSSQWYSSVH